MNLRLDSILLFALVTPFIMIFNLAPFSTPYWFFGLIFSGLLGFLILDLVKINQKKFYTFKEFLLWIIIALVVGSAFRAAIIERHITHPIYKIHDMPLQQEIAVRFLLDGKNPYSQTYFGTFLEQWHYSDTEKNPALYHFVLLPLYLLFVVPFYVVSNSTIGFFDARIPLIFLFLILLIFARTLVRYKNRRFIFLILLAFNPAIIPYAIEGRSDLFMFPFLFLGLFLLYKNKLSLAGIPMGLAFAVKQSAWPILPFYIAYLFFKTKNFSETVKSVLPFLITLLLIVGPFIFWNSKAFLDSTVFYLSGNAENSYPIAGYGLGKLLNQLGFIKDVHANYPFWIWQILIAFPLMIFLVLWQRRENSVIRLIVSYGIYLFVFWYLSRYFNNSHLGYLSLIFITAYFWPKEKVSK